MLILFKYFLWNYISIFNVSMTAITISLFPSVLRIKSISNQSTFSSAKTLKKLMSYIYSKYSGFSLFPMSAHSYMWLISFLSSGIIWSRDFFFSLKRWSILILHIILITENKPEIFVNVSIQDSFLLWFLFFHFAKRISY